MSNFTPGPWMLSKNYYYDSPNYRCTKPEVIAFKTSELIKNPRINTDKYGFSVCRISETRNVDKQIGDKGLVTVNVPRGEQYANMCLIAAAPELYEACKEMLESQFLLDSRIPKWKAATAKAEGIKE